MVALIAVIGSSLWFEVIYAGFEIFFSEGKSRANCHDPCGSPWMMEDTGGVRASAGRGRSIL
ncbi:hypothetical protein [Comamonas thiooxydans]|uniref:hypothetical protein n=1 Tax=Comamonas thiooxydans TaxID=363952 RepID=UPI001E3F5113|nr:hypothetical protein [Comamonas thiooxydans]